MVREDRRMDFSARALSVLWVTCAGAPLPLKGSGEGPERAVASHPAEFEGLHNVIRVAPELVNGSAPEGDAGFDSLQRMGIKTLICVDGGAPDVERAAARGIRCVHLPIGYDGIEKEQGLKLMRAVRDLPKPIYLHCLHGKHRSPAAAGAVMVGLGRMSPEEALGLLRTAGTSSTYEGLYESVRSASKVEEKRLDEVSPDYPERAPVTSLVQSMVDLGHSFEHLEKLETAGWKPPSDHPDLDPKNEARILHRLLDQLVEKEAQRTRPQGFVAGLKEADAAALGLMDTLNGGEMAHPLQALNRVRGSCVSCHERFRD